ncbi:hypothetical protein H8I69_17435 [Serratia fonticola]|uniref:glycosyl hydrolase family 28 protein n=1 Tax=Serratia fonticola TaxID=47917 RepID=UPI0015C5B5CE|nr:glycosyl hydrolase family 28 protein [Serratia fonticola]MBC3380902.1 hypothetical protein [Serratia fonticola]NYA40101.1 hypothetical protein [Serratia fonticola]
MTFALFSKATTSSPLKNNTLLNLDTLGKECSRPIDLISSKIIDCKYIEPESFYRESDGDDYTRCINEALDIAVKSNKIVILNGKYRITKTLELSTNTIITGRNGSEIFCDKNKPITLIKAKGCQNILIFGVNFNGNVTENIGKNYTRVIVFIECKNIILKGISAGNNADWCISFETCTDVSVKKVNIYGGGRGLPGGRDGIHFLDCINFSVISAIIDSGDDCIGITTKYRGTSHGYISDVRGKSEIGSIVIYNEEKLVDGQYSGNTLNGLTIENISVNNDRKSATKNIVRVIGYNPVSEVKNVTVNGVSGISNDHGVFIGGVNKLKIENINVLSIKQHGVYIINSSEIYGNSVTGRSMTDKFFGINIVKCHNVKGSFESMEKNVPKSVHIQGSDEIKIVKSVN